MNIPLLAGFLGAATILTITPGVDTAMVLRTAATSGRRPALAAATGISVGCLAWGAAVALGLGALIRTSPLAYSIIKFAGAAYLLQLGVRMIWRPRAAFDAGESRASAGHSRDALIRGLLTNILNPKIGVFYVSFLPQFVPPGSSVPGYTFILACIHVALGVLWFVALIAATAPLRTLLRRPVAVRVLDRLTGTIFVVFGAKLAASSAT